MPKSRKVVKSLDGEEDDGTKDDGEWVPCSADGSKKCSRGSGGSSSSASSVTNDGEENGARSPVLNATNDYSHNSDDDGLHLPAGQHLLVDIKDVDAMFLNSEERLARAMISLIDESKLTLLSYHCHSLVPIGVSCVGVLLESHISFHTWPLEWVITLDLFTCGGTPLILVLPSIERLFAVPRVGGKNEEEDSSDSSDGDEEEPEGESSVQPSMLWAHKLRGFREGFAPNYRRESNPLDQHLGRFVLGKLDFDVKRPLLSTKTDFQSVDVYELLYPRFRDVNSYRQSLSQDGSYESLHPELFAPDRVLFLDGVIQSTLYGDAPYHESIVHPAMMAHDHPERVAIIGGGEGATLREALKHSSVKKAVMIEIDKEIVQLSKEYLPEWCDCSDIVGSVDWCLDDQRVEARFEDAMGYFADHFGNGMEEGGGEKKNEEKATPFDIIIMDALDPIIDVEFAMDLYHSDRFIEALYSGLTESGILAVQIGETPGLTYPADEMGPFLNRALMMKKLEDVGFRSMHVYEESHSGFTWPWSTLVAFKDFKSRANWYRNSAEIDLAIRKRMIPTKSGRSSLKNYDGATHLGYQMPPKPFETVYCRSVNTPEECSKYRGFPTNYDNVPISDFEVKRRSGSSTEIGVFTRKMIPKNSSIALGQRVESFITHPTTWSVIKSLEAKANEGVAGAKEKVAQLLNYIEGFGYCDIFLGQTHCCADSGIRSFMKRVDVDKSNFGETASLNNIKTAVYSPVVDRHMRQILIPLKATSRDIQKGEEILKGIKWSSVQ